MPSFRKATKHAGEEELIGVYAFTTYKKDAFVIGRLSDGRAIIGDVGDLDLKQGDTYRFFGKWVEVEKYGKQFKFSAVIQDTPLNEDGIVKYLVDNIDGVGYSRARGLFAKYKDKAVDILSDDPERVVSDGLLSNENAIEASKLLKQMVATRKTTIDLLGLFHGRGFPKKLLRQVTERWGAAAPKQIRANPYVLLIEKFSGCGFMRTDKMYIDLKHDPASIQRQMFCGWHAMNSDRSGSTWHPVGMIFDSIRQMIGSSELKPIEAIKQGCKDSWLTLWNKNCDLAKKEGWIADRKKAVDESTVSKELKRLLSSTVVSWPKTVDPGCLIDGKKITAHQLEEAAKSLSLQVGVLSGTPGTGKTFLAGAVIRAIASTYGAGSLCVCAPTGRAAVRLTQSIRSYGIMDVQAATIHRTLSMIPGEEGFSHNASNKLPYRFVIVDEVSMIGIGLLASLLVALKDGCHVLFVGDKHQLPPVEHGAPFRDMLEFLTSVGTLRMIHRNSGDIVKSCINIKLGKEPIYCDQFDDDKKNNLRMIHASSHDEQLDALARFMKACISHDIDVFGDIQIIVPLNAKSPVSRKNINPMLQSLLNSGGHRIDGCKYRVGDKVACLKNSWLKKVKPQDSIHAEDFKYEMTGDDDPVLEYVANGEIGRVVAISKNKGIICFFDNPFRLVKVHVYEDRKDDDGNDSEGDFDLGYAVTCHKMQGSQQRYVVIMADDYRGADFICCREWWYTALSRGEYRVLVIGKKETIRRHCKRVSVEDRKTFLVRRMEIDAAKVKKTALEASKELGQKAIATDSKRSVARKEVPGKRPNANMPKKKR